MKLRLDHWIYDNKNFETRPDLTIFWHNFYLYFLIKVIYYVHYIIVKHNLHTTRTKHLYVPNKLYELSEQICIRIEQILQTIKTKHLYVPNKLYELLEQICIRVEQTIKTKHLYVSNTLYELSEQICICARTKHLYVPNTLYELSEQIRICVE
jgi:hypothetical protein